LLVGGHIELLQLTRRFQRGRMQLFWRYHFIEEAGTKAPCGSNISALITER
jgi:hypothetical protein